MSAFYFPSGVIQFKHIDQIGMRYQMNSILVHGLGQTASSWEKVKTRLRLGGEVFCPDLYAIAGTEQIDYLAIYSAFSVYCDQIEGSLYLCGLSLGAVLALQYALEHPERVDSLILIAPQYKMPRFLLALQNILFSIMPQSVFSEMGLTKEAFVGICNSMAVLDFSATVSSLRCRTVLICGEKDWPNIKAARKLHAILPASQLRLVSDAGHELNVEAPENLAEILNECWNRGE